MRAAQMSCIIRMLRSYHLDALQIVFCYHHAVIHQLGICMQAELKYDMKLCSPVEVPHERTHKDWLSTATYMTKTALLHFHVSMCAREVQSFGALYCSNCNNKPKKHSRDQ